MNKSLTQITFEFAAEEENKIKAAVVDEQEETPAKTAVTEESPQIEESINKEEKEEPAKRKSARGRLSLKEIHLNADLVQIPPDEILFQKQYYAIGEVAKWFRVNQSLIRYWETEFDILEPRKNRKGDRFFRPIDVKNLVLIHDLLRRRKFTIEGAKEFLKKNNAQHPAGKAQEKFVMIQSLEKLKTFLNELKASL
ncbi:MAG TPA: MerR family transcriptional regulator [Chitinophagaceae bacterium]|nr:MerR family transcriptional regulator [Chitinophagaceae bacterium]